MKRIATLASLFFLPNVVLFMLMLIRARESFQDALWSAVITFPYMYSLFLTTSLDGIGVTITSLVVMISFLASCAFSHKTIGLVLAIALLGFHYLLTSATILVVVLGGFGSG